MLNNGIVIVKIATATCLGQSGIRTTARLWPRRIERPLNRIIYPTMPPTPPWHPRRKPCSAVKSAQPVQYRRSDGTLLVRPVGVRCPTAIRSIPWSTSPT
jgi:hypothetical protein